MVTDSRTLKSADEEIQTAAADEHPVLYCANHPETETLLRCNRCDKPICIKCAVQTPVGFRCRECVRNQQSVYFNAAPSDNLVAFGVAFLLTAIATPLVGFFLAVAGWFSFLIAILAGSAAGSALAQIVRRAISRRRGRNLRWFALAGILLGMIVGSVAALFAAGFFPLFYVPVLIFGGLAIASAMPFLK